MPAVHDILLLCGASSDFAHTLVLLQERLKSRSVDVWGRQGSKIRYCSTVARIVSVEFLSPGSLRLLAATSAQMRRVMRPLVTKISIKEQDVYVEVDFGVLRNAIWSGVEQLSLHTHTLCPQTMPIVVSADLARLTKLDFCHSAMEPQTVSILA